MSNGSPTEELLRWFELFWQFAEDGYAEGLIASRPLFGVRANWEYWWNSKLAPIQRDELQQLASQMSLSRPGQEEFIARLERRFRHRYGAGACKLALVQIARLDLFQEWRAFAARIADVAKVNAIILNKPFGARTGDIQPLVFSLIPKGPSEPAIAFLNLEVNEAAAERAYGAILSLLRGKGLLLLLSLAALFGSKPRPRWMRVMRWFGWVSLATTLFLLLSVPALLAVALHPVLIMLLAFTFLMGGSSVVSYGREAMHGWRLARLLKQNQICVFATGLRDGVTLDVSGPSLSFALVQGILLALREDTSVFYEDSWLWGHYFRHLKAKLPHWAFTGDIRASGMVVPVERLSDKVEAARIHPAITALGIPVQDAGLPSVMSRAHVANPVSPTEVVFGDPSQLRLYRFWHIAPFVLGVGGLLRAWAVPFNLLCLASFVIACVGLPDAWRHFSPPPRPEFTYWKCEIVDYEFSGRSLKLWFKTDYPDQFFIRLDPSLFRGKDTLPLIKESLFPGQATVEIQLSELNGLSPKDRLQWNFFVVRPERFLGHLIREVPVIQAPAWGVMQRAEKDRQLGLSVGSRDSYLK